MVTVYFTCFQQNPQKYCDPAIGDLENVSRIPITSRYCIFKRSQGKRKGSTPDNRRLRHV
jgi:hypothetical protein